MLRNTVRRTLQSGRLYHVTGDCEVGNSYLMSVLGGDRSNYLLEGVENPSIRSSNNPPFTDRINKDSGPEIPLVSRGCRPVRFTEGGAGRRQRHPAIFFPPAR